MIKALLIDIDGTMVDSRAANVALFQTILEHAGYAPPSSEAILEHFHLPLWQSLERLTGITDQEEIGRIWSLSHDRTMRSPQLYDFPEQFEQTLEALRRDYRLGIVTGRTRAGTEDFLDARPIRDLFETSVVFEEYQQPKPHPEPLLMGAARLGLRPEEIAYVGDSVIDVQAAQAAGMPSVHLSHAPHPAATASIARFMDLPGAISQLEKQLS